MITGSTPKRQKHESLTDALSGAATAFAKVFNTSPSESPRACVESPRSSTSNVGISPSKSADIRMKHLEQLRYMQQLMEDRVLSESEFAEQKEIVLSTLGR